MEETSKKKGMLGKLVNIITGKPPADSFGSNKGDQDLQGKHAPAKNDPLDLAFVKNFTLSGGKFLYCEDYEEAYRYLSEIASETGIQRVLCQNPDLNSILQRAGISAEENTWHDVDAFASPCEFLVSFNGGIMITARQTHGRKLSELPDTFITFAYTSQITENLRSALSGIRRRYHGNIPSQITTIKGPRKVSEIEDNQPGHVCNKEIYLLLLEDQQ